MIASPIASGATTKYLLMKPPEKMNVSLLYRLDRNGDGHVVACRGRVFRHAEVRALDARDDFGTASRLFGRGVNGAPEVGYRERDRLGHAAHRQLAFGAYQGVADELQLVRLEGDGRELGSVEIVLAPEQGLAR